MYVICSSAYRKYNAEDVDLKSFWYCILESGVEKVWGGLLQLIAVSIYSIYIIKENARIAWPIGSVPTEQIFVKFGWTLPLGMESATVGLKNKNPFPKSYYKAWKLDVYWLSIFYVHLLTRK